MARDLHVRRREEDGDTVRLEKIGGVVVKIEREDLGHRMINQLLE